MLVRNVAFGHLAGKLPENSPYSVTAHRVLVLCSEPIFPATMVQCYPIGVISMIDDGKMDEKIIAIPFREPMYNLYNDISQLPHHIFDEMMHFFEVYKVLEHKKTSVKEIKGRESALNIVEKCIERYNAEIVGKD